MIKITMEACKRKWESQLDMVLEKAHEMEQAISFSVPTSTTSSLNSTAVLTHSFIEMW